jgi:outer membrane protein OmpA-like peptidoglycan-associated protein
MSAGNTRTSHRVTIALASFFFLLQPLCAAPRPADILRIATQPGLGATLAVPLLLGFLQQNGSLAIQPMEMDHADGGHEWRLATPPRRPFVPVIGIVRVSDQPFDLVKDGKADIVITAAVPTPGELALLSHIGDWTAIEGQRIIALEGIALIANNSLRQQPVEAKEVTALLSSGQLPAKAEGQGRMLHLFVSTADAGALGPAFDRLGMHGVAPPYGASVTLMDPTEIIRNVEQDNLAVGLLGSGGKLFESDARQPVTVVGIGDCGNAFPLSPETVLTEEYPLIEEIRLLSPSDSVLPSSVQHFIKEFVRYTSSEAATIILRKSGYAVPTIEEYSPESTYVQQKLSIMATLGVDHAQLADFQSFVHGASQVSQIVRFAYKESDLDESAQQMLAAIARQVIPELQAGRHILVAGFADAGGNDPAANLQLSRKRANNVAEELRRGYGADIAKDDSQGFGQLGYFGCRRGGEGDRLSRRAEVWVR